MGVMIRGNGIFWRNRRAREERKVKRSVVKSLNPSRTLRPLRLNYLPQKKSHNCKFVCFIKIRFFLHLKLFAQIDFSGKG